MEPRINDLLTQIDNDFKANRINLNIVTESIIINVIRDYFPKLGDNDINVLNVLVVYLINYTCIKLNINNIEQWTQNNNRDIKAVINLLLPYIDDKDNSYLLKNLTDLNHLYYSSNTRNIPDDIKYDSRDEILNKYFKYGNMGIGLLKNIDNNLFQNNGDKIIYKIIHHNFIALLKTLSIINGKLYINWINIEPLNLNNYKNSQLYNTTINNKPTIFTVDTFINTEIDFNYNGLWVGDIYNILVNKYYYQAKKIKWLIFPYEYNIRGGVNRQYLIQYLFSYLTPNFTNNIDFAKRRYEFIDDDTKYYFIQNLKTMADIFRNNIGNNSPDISIMFDVFKYFLTYLYNNYEFKKNLIKTNDMTNFRMFNINNLDDEEKENDFTVPLDRYIRRNNISELLDYIILCIERIKDVDFAKQVWNFINDYSHLLEHSVYGKFIFDENGLTQNYYYNYIGPNKINNNVLNLKNIYNICKSLSHNTTNGVWTPNDRHYISLNFQMKQAFFNNLINGNGWISLSGNLARQKRFIVYNYNYELNNILAKFREVYLELVFEELVVTGILSDFKIDIKQTNEAKYPLGYNAIKKYRKKKLEEKFDNNPQWADSYYYVTNDKYSKLKLRIENKEQYPKYTEENYFKCLIEENDWYKFYAMDWLCQINFFHHYLNHQVLYITGATGQGKSTQVPKLLLYAMKMLDYKENGKIICTQPRIPPTIGNSDRISFELGVPMLELSNTSDEKIKTSNYYIQYKYQLDAHTNENIHYNSLQICTDGTLYEQLKSNPTLMKQIIHIDRHNQEKTLYIDTNMYDIMIIDEAHEHNVNMDLILTLARQTCYMNNSVKLIIVSATMDDDEPIYRRYYKYINDNLAYPLKCPFRHPILRTINNFFPRTEYMDRRYHISPPGATTQYTVDEHYLDKDLDIYINNKLDEKKSADLAQLKSYEYIIDICKKSSNGNLLFFANGQKEIIEAVKYLNEKLPIECIAIPYFSEMNQKYKDIIAKIGTTINKIKNKKTNIYNEWSATFIEDKTVQDNIYKRAVIIATNVAEASVTIDNLLYVVDNGYAKVNKYVPELNTTNLVIEKISESSRVQRRGRVGRINSGTVYYMYTKNARKHIKSKYKITQENISQAFMKLLESLKELLKNRRINIEDIMNPHVRRNEYIVDNDYNPNIYKNVRQIIDFNTGIVVPQGLYLADSNYMNIIKNKYFIRNFLIDYVHNTQIYYSDDPNYYNLYNNIAYKNTIDFKNETPYMFIMTHLGISFPSLIDNYCNFYLIHPFENNITRNIFNNIIKYDNKITNIVPYEKYVYLLSSIINNYYIANIKCNNLYQTDTDIRNIKDCFFIKTELGDFINDLTKEANLTKYLELNEKDIISLIAAKALNCFIDVFEIIIFLITINKSLTNLISRNIKFDKFYKLYNCSENHSDILFIYKIIQKFKKEFPILFSFNKKYDSEINDILNDFISNYKYCINNNIRPEPRKTFINGIIWNKLTNLYVNNKLDINNANIIRQYSIKIFVIEKYKTKIIEWCDNNYLNSDIMIKFIEKLEENKEVYDLINTDDINKNIDKISSNFLKTNNINNKEECIIKSFLYGNSDKIAFKLSTNDTKYKTKISKNIIDAKYQEIQYYTNTLTSKSYTILLYLNSMIKDTSNILEFSLVTRIDPKWLLDTNILLINPLNFNKSKMSGDAYERLIETIDNNWNLNNFIWNSDEFPILSYFCKNIKNLLRIYSNK
jgi:hypothetical protein